MRRNTLKSNGCTEFCFILSLGGANYGMSSYKKYFQHQLERVKSTASQLIQSKEDERVMELEPEAYERLRQWAADRHTTVQALVNDMIDRYLSSQQPESIRPIAQERLERNPLLRLDGLCGREL
jgi:hypothetical protein